MRAPTASGVCDGRLRHIRDHALQCVYDGDQPTLVPRPCAPTVEAHKTEPDKNTYLVFRHGLPGADSQYDYGSHFLFQGHESGTPGYITRVNLDSDAAHRGTLLATADTSGANLPDFDGSTWDPFAGELLFTAELGATGGVWQSDLAVPVFRLLPKKASDLTQGGRLQALQVVDNGQPIAFHAGQADADIKSAGMLDLHAYGKVLPTTWVTIHDTATDGFTPFTANALAKAASATPFKRPENDVFAPDGSFRTFVFTETGDTNVNTEAGATYGGFGALMKLRQSPTTDSGNITILYRGDVAHTGSTTSPSPAGARSRPSRTRATVCTPRRTPTHHH